MALQWIEYLKQSGWMDLLNVGGIAGIVISVVTLSWNELREARVSRREARHVALTVALSLESYGSTHRLADCREPGWRAIVVDTSIFDAQQSDLESGLLRRVEHDRIRVLMPDVIRREAQAHLSRDVIESLDYLWSTRKPQAQTGGDRRLAFIYPVMRSFGSK